MTANIPEINFVDDASVAEDASDVQPEQPETEAVPVSAASADSGVSEAASPVSESSKVVPVDVRRADGPSPFRSTADVTARETIEGAVKLPEAQFAADGRPIAVIEGADANRTVENFLNVVSRRVDVVGRPEPIAALPPADDEGPTLRILHVDVDVIEDDVDAAAATMASPAWRSPHASAPAAPPQKLERGPVIVAFLVGLILGFCAGLLASELL